MESVQAKTGKNVSSRLKEAEIYYSMGLFSESLHVYKKILDDTPELDAETKSTVEAKITSIQTDLENHEEPEDNQYTPQDKDFIRETLIDETQSGSESISSILDSASAYMELGLYAEATSEYEKLLHREYPLSEIIPRIVECLFKTHSTSKLTDQIDKIVNGAGLSREKTADISYRIGRELEKRDRKDLALDLYKSAKELAPKGSTLEANVNSIISSLSSESRYDYLLHKKIVTTEQLQQALVQSKKKKKSIEHILVEIFNIEKEEVGKSLSFFYGCPFKAYDPDTTLPMELANKLKKPYLLQQLWIPLGWSKDGVEVLIHDPKDLNKTDHIRTLFNTKSIHFSVGIKEDIEAYIRDFFGGGRMGDLSAYEEGEDTGDLDLIPEIDFEEEEEPLEEEKEELDEASGKVVRLVDQMLIAAYRKNASDVHIEPSPVSKATSIRFRVDGVCQEYISVPNSMARGLAARVKIMAGLDIAEKRLPQDGKIKFRRKGVPPFELRVATLPTAGNFEDVVLRILGKAGVMKLDDIALSERNLETMKSILVKPYGLILVVGPTGSGKTTTLHSALSYINKPGIKIWTAEDPIEITQRGLRQVEVKPKIGLDFARVMRSFLRADPDIVMIGEMRDEETAHIGIEASLTGHLVFSTLHTNSAPETVTRLLDMGLNPLNFSDAFLGVLAQRLVRRLCQKCRTQYNPTEEQFEEIVREYGQDYFEKTGVHYAKDMVLYAPAGCEACDGTGYKGRLGIHELLSGTKEIKRMIKAQATTEELFEKGIEQGMTTLKQDGISKVFQGLTDFEEVRRVCVV